MSLLHSFSNFIFWKKLYWHNGADLLIQRKLRLDRSFLRSSTTLCAWRSWRLFLTPIFSHIRQPWILFRNSDSFQNWLWSNVTWLVYISNISCFTAARSLPPYPFSFLFFPLFCHLFSVLSGRNTGHHPSKQARYLGHDRSRNHFLPYVIAQELSVFLFSYYCDVDCVQLSLLLVVFNKNWFT